MAPAAGSTGPIRPGRAPLVAWRTTTPAERSGESIARDVIGHDRHRSVSRSGRVGPRAGARSSSERRSPSVSSPSTPSGPRAPRPPPSGPARSCRSACRRASRPTTLIRSWSATRPAPRMTDVDGNEYVDYDMGFGALFAGHMHPAVRRAVEAQLDDGTLYVTPCELERRRSPSCSPTATACRCGASPTRAPRRRWTPSGSPRPPPGGTRSSRSRAATTATTTR